ncbi:MAG: hypothetical protein KKA19_00015, partial [Candidatus Margulisbacteria bacterium]|nr:hypothetical protein [Candidatus Margulisiibacteriota bacterium]
MFYIFLILLFFEACLHLYSFYLANTCFSKSIFYGQYYVPYVSRLTSIFDWDTRQELLFQKSINYYDTAPEIWLFGGSTMQGNHWQKTIPSKLASLLHLKNKQYVVRNFGQPAFVFDQERILFLELLRKNTSPQIVIFYDGANEFLPQIVGYPACYQEHISFFDNIPNLSKFSKYLSQAK